MTTDIGAILAALSKGRVEFILIGGAAKRAAGRSKDFEAIAELEALLEERQKMEE